jgi:hypothetical protein
MTIISGHQPNFLPGTRFYYKLAKSDVMDLRYKVQFIERGFIHRVKMRDNWLTLPIQDKKHMVTAPIDQIRVDLPAAKDLFRRTMHGRYSGARFYKTRGLELVEKFDSLGSDYLWQMNLDMMLYLRDQLGITTPIGLGIHTDLQRAEGVLAAISPYPGVDTYLSGMGAKKYMGDTTVFDEAGIKVVWSRHVPVTDDSVVSLLMDHTSPIDYVMREEAE